MEVLVEISKINKNTFLSMQTIFALFGMYHVEALYTHEKL